MNDRQTRTLRTFKGVVPAAQAAFPRLGDEAALIIEHFTRTVEELDRVSDLQMFTDSMRRSQSPRLHIDTMRQRHMLPLARLGRRLFAGDSAITSALAMPHKRAPTDEILAAADRMVKVLRPHRAFISESGSDAKRIAVLSDEVRRVRNLVRAADGAVADRAVPTRRIAELFASARRDIQALDGLIAATLDKRAIRTWKDNIKIGGRIGRPKQPRRSTKKRAVA
ncbi:MAG: hypothetical protein ABJE47_04620 [bacterium]